MQQVWIHRERLFCKYYNISRQPCDDGQEYLKGPSVWDDDAKVETLSLEVAKVFCFFLLGGFVGASLN